MDILVLSDMCCCQLGIVACTDLHRYVVPSILCCTLVRVVSLVPLPSFFFLFSFPFSLFIVARFARLETLSEQVFLLVLSLRVCCRDDSRIH